MKNINFILLVSLLSLFICSSCKSDFDIEAQSKISSESNPIARLLKYQTKLSEGDFVGVNRLYSKRVLAMKINNRRPEDCKKTEDCLTAADRIAGFEASIAGGQSNTLKEIQTSDANRIQILTVPPFPLSVKVIYELVHEDGDWYIDKALWESGEIIAGYEEVPLKGDAGVIVNSSK